MMKFLSIIFYATAILLISKCHNSSGESKINKNRMNNTPDTRELILSESHYMTPPDGEVPEILTYFPDSINKAVTAIQKEAITVKELNSSGFFIQPPVSLIE